MAMAPDRAPNSGSMALARPRLRRNRPAAMSSRNESATWPVMKASRILVRTGRPPADSSLSAGTSAGREACIEGTSPSSTPVNSEIPTANAMTRKSTGSSSRTGTPIGGWKRCSSWVIHAVIRSPSPPPMKVTSALSVTNWRISRPRVAPSASRMAISRRRAAARASRSPARLAQATRSTSPTTTIRSADPATAGPRASGGAILIRDSVSRVSRRPDAAHVGPFGMLAVQPLRQDRHFGLRGGGGDAGLEPPGQIERPVAATPLILRRVEHRLHRGGHPGVQLESP